MMSLLAAATAAAATPGVARAPYGITKAGAAVERIVLTNPSGMRVGILTLGGIIDEITVPARDGRRANVVLALPDLAAYEAKPNFGSLVGRYAGRISRGGFSIDGTRYPLSADPEVVVSHGGVPNFAAKVWRAEPCTEAGCSAVTLHYTSPDGENGFPGTLEIAVTYTLTADDTLRLDYAATTSRATVLNLTHHAYFNLAGGTSGSADNQNLQINASRIAELDARRIPTGALLPVDGTPFDLRTPARIGDRIGSTHPLMLLARGFDHGFAIDGSGLRLAARAFDPASGRSLEVSTTEPSLQVYTANSFDGSLIGAGGRTIRQGDGYALETQHFPDSPNRPEFPSTLLRPGETFRSTTSFRFGVERKAGD
ncbi:aldose epimerase family protein [Sphingosinicella sp. BN140058]|uniref:aldose epimerase family protein n=1 Tax=Sphingosinicella sp. BN140058 TaxID=1892855 RepID=UPI001011F609|nr:aldose epimerase family protein [Sphingosinicella sp. BN140058]QAY78374.1 galactose mutarotase [Sphingosinicella sp. BN140058]